MKNVVKWAMVLPLSAALILSGCKKDEEEIVPFVPPPIDNPVEGLVMVGSGSIDENETDVRVYAEKDLFVGYNKLYVVLLEKGSTNQITSAHVMLKPMMAMNSGMNHSCPTENPEDQNPAEGLFVGAAIFIMPSGDMGNWTLNVTVHNHNNGLEGEVGIPISVMNPPDTRVFSFKSPVDQKSIFITMIEPSMPAVGMNDFIVAAHYRADMMNFPPLEDLNISFEPEMPTMGHGSPNNVNPVHTENGHYQGVVNFTMDGFWRLNMFIADQNDVILDETHYFDVNF
ncbi:MAG: FixH family protein [Vicingaceae bacterium]